MLLKKDTARDRMVLMVDETDHVTGLDGLTLTITLSKNAAAFASVSPTVTGRGDGWYKVAWTSGDIDTNGDFAWHVEAPGADPSDIDDQVVPALPGEVSATSIQAVWDALTASLSTANSIGKLLVDNINATISSRSTYAGADTAGTTTLLSRLGSPVGASISADIAGVPAAIMAAVVEGAYTVKHFLRLIGSATLGKLSGGATVTNTFRDTGDTKNRIVATVDSSGNRTAVTLDPT